MPKDFARWLRSIAPKIKGHFLNEVAVNRYEVGQGMAEHIDKAVLRLNMVSPLQSEGDGLYIGEDFVEDVRGAATVFGAVSPPHYVPPAKNQRFLLLFLYE